MAAVEQHMNRVRVVVLAACIMLVCALAACLTDLPLCAFAAGSVSGSGSGAQESTLAQTIASASESSSTTGPNLTADPLDGVTAAGQMVVLVRFAGDTVGDAGTTGAEAGYNAEYAYTSSANPRTQWEYVQKRLNTVPAQTYDLQTFRGYVREASGNTRDVISAFPQTTDGGGVSYITLPQSFAAYAKNDQLLAQDVAAQFNAAYSGYDVSAFDSDADGYLDNLLVIMAVGESDSLTSHATDAAGFGYTLGAGTTSAGLGQMTVVDGRVYEDANGNIADTFSERVAAHEYLHTLGARDLYRYDATQTTGIPVGVWDEMASGSSFSRPLAITRQDMGWTTLSEVENEGSYTLSSAGDAVIVRSPLSSSEYFVIEYRQKGSNYRDLDRYIGGSGIVVYRVNPAYAEEGNYAGNDYVYVFRPNETGVGDAAGSVTTAQLGTSAYGASWQTVGSTDLSKGITDGALTFANGANSGLAISVTSQTDGSVTFTVEHADYDAAGVWEDASDADGNLPFTGSSVQDVQLEEADGALYALVQSWSNSAYSYEVWSYVNGMWADLGSVGTGLYGGQLVCHDGVLYVAGIDYSNNMVKVYSRISGAWQQAASATGTAPNVVNLASVGGSLFVLADAQLYTLSDGSLVAQGSPLGFSSVNVQRAQLFELDGVPAAIVADWDALATGLYVFSDGAWAEKATLLDSCASVIDVCALDGVAYAVVAASGSAPGVFSIAADCSIQTIEVADLPATVLDASVVADDGCLYVSAIEGASGYTASMLSLPLDGSAAASALGGTVAAPVKSMDSAVLGGNVFCGCATETGTALIRLHAVAGDDSGSGGDSGDSGSDSGSDVGGGDSGDSSGGSSSGGSTEPGGDSGSGTVPAVVETQAMYRLYNPNSGEHFYTASAGERDNLVSVGWNYEGVGWIAPKSSNTPVYRMYNPTVGPNGSGEHHYTTSVAERDMLKAAGWSYEGVGWYSDDAKGVPLYRQYNPNAFNCNHNYTASKSENDWLVSLGWKAEGIAWYGVEQ